MLGGTQSLHTNGYDEALALPTSRAATLALRTQQIVAYESGVADTVDPLAGSYYVEHLTDELERAAMTLLAEVDKLGGAEQAIEMGFIQEEIGRSAYEHQKRVEAGENIVVGVNKFGDGEAPPVIPAPDFSKLAREQVERVRAVRANRDAKAAAQALEALRSAAAKPANARDSLMPLIIAAVRARTTLGEISDAFVSAWGVHRAS